VARLLANTFKAFKSTFIGVPIIITALFLSLSIISFNKHDPSLNRSTNQAVQNVAGKYGAYIADPLLQSLGYAVLIPITFIALTGLRLLQRKKAAILSLRTAFMLFSTLILAMLLSYLDEENAYAINGMGGYTGLILKKEVFLRFESNKIMLMLSLFIGPMILYCLGCSIKQFKSLFATAYSFIYIVYGLTNWGWKVVYTMMLKMSRRVKGYDTETDELLEIPKAKTLVEIVSKPKKAEAKALQQSKLKLDPEEFELPATSLLKEIADKIMKNQVNEVALSQNSKLLQQVLNDYGIQGEMIKIHPGPVVTLYEFEPSAGIKSSRIIGLADDIARSMSAVSARIAVIPGKSTLGIELPNSHRELVFLRELLESKTYQQCEDKLPLILGKNIAGEPVIADLSKMPHLLVAGTTGSGKSVAINTMILSLLYKHSPKQCRFIMIDPKMLELSVYDGIPHLLAPVVTEPKKAVTALKWVVKEMENRYRSMSSLGVRNIEGYNKVLNEAVKSGKKFERQVQVGFDPETGKPLFETIVMDSNPLPLIVVIVDEMADLMLVAGKEIEGSIQRLAQMARAAGIHLIMATQRPSVDVITGVIKANFPTRISFQVTSKIDSRTILGEQGAEQLLGMGDMLYMRGGGRIERVHGPFVDDREVECISRFLKEQGVPDYISTITQSDEDSEFDGGEFGDSGDDLYNQAVQIVVKEKKASTSYIQRCLRIGYNRAANIIEKMEKEGIVSAPNHVGKRDVLINNE
jgi:S-DNA-T family DNA segregation ATPase FtsK/SpoIIIE